MKIKTNNTPRSVLYWYDLTDKERAELETELDRLLGYDTNFGHKE